MALAEKWWLSTYAADIYNYLRIRERRRMNYRGQSPQLRCRRDLVCFIGEICDKMHLCVAVHHLATHLLDFFMDDHDIELHRLKPLSLGCLIVAAKAEEVDPLIPTNSEIVKFMNNSFTCAHLVCMEMSVLHFFDWEVHHPTIATFLDYFALLALFPGDVAKFKDSPAQLQNLESSLKTFLSYFLDTALKDHGFIKMPASMVAAACVVCSRMCLCLHPLWSPLLEDISMYTLEQLTPCVNRLFVVKPVMDPGARAKDPGDDSTDTSVSGAGECGARCQPDCATGENDRRDDVTFPEGGDGAQVDSDAEDLYAVDEERLAELEKDMTEEEKMAHRERAQKLKATGNNRFKEGQYTEALEAYTEALRISPLCATQERSVLFSNRAAAWTRLEKKKLAVKDCTTAIELNPSYLKPVLKRAQLHKELDNLDDSLKDYQRVLEMDPSIGEARHACMTLPDQIKERNERLQAEMLGKLKELGNLCLKPFGMSTENFKLVKDEASGGYQIKFQK
ncbi:unnamed protein product [Ixodes hexagonus]